MFQIYFAKTMDVLSLSLISINKRVTPEDDNGNHRIFGTVPTPLTVFPRVAAKRDRVKWGESGGFWRTGHLPATRQLKRIIALGVTGHFSQLRVKVDWRTFIVFSREKEQTLTRY